MRRIKQKKSLRNCTRQLSTFFPAYQPVKKTSSKLIRKHTVPVFVTLSIPYTYRNFALGQSSQPPHLRSPGTRAQRRSCAHCKEQKEEESNQIPEMNFFKCCSSGQTTDDSDPGPFSKVGYDQENKKRESFQIIARRSRYQERSGSFSTKCTNNCKQDNVLLDKASSDPRPKHMDPKNTDPVHCLMYCVNLKMIFRYRTTIRILVLQHQLINESNVHI